MAVLAGFCLFAGAAPVRAQTVEETQREFNRGHYDAVIETARKKVAAGGYLDGWHVLLVKALLTRGRYAEARTNALAGVEEFTGSMQLRLLARETALLLNNTNGAARDLDEIRYQIERRGRIEQSGDNLAALGRALILLGVEPRLALENCFKKAREMEPSSREAWLATGELALDKHDYSLAADTFRGGLEKFADDPDLLSGLARSFENGDGDELSKALDAALKVNPAHIPSLLLLAGGLIDSERFDEAEKQLDLVLKVNAVKSEAFAYRAAIAYLRGDQAKGDAARAQALHGRPANPQVDHLIGLKLARKYLFEEGAAAQRRALAMDTNYLPARRQLAEDLLRLGDEEEGWKLIREVRARDEYDVTAYNLTTLHDQLAKFRTLTNDDFVVRMSAREADIYGDRVLALLGRAKAALCPKYGVQLKRRTIVEIYPAQKDFAVRTFGLPGNPGYLGVCFGSVITANSPASQAPNPANWEDVLWHEFCHVVTLTATHNRMPRWLSEGISEYEERVADPAWGEHMNLAYRRFILGGDLTPIAGLSAAFMQPKTGEHLQFAYFEASLLVEFLINRYGRDAFLGILTDLREGREANAAITARSAPLAELEKQFAAFVRQQAEALAPGTDLEKPPADPAARKAWAVAHPKNYELAAEEARKLVAAGRWAEARPLLEKLADSYSGERRADNPLWSLALAQRNLGDTNAEAATLKRLAAVESDFVELNLRLMELARSHQDWPAAAAQARRLLQIQPLIVAPYRTLAAAAAATGEATEGIDAWRRLLLLDPPDPVEAHFSLARLVHQRGGAEAEARRQVLDALEDAPRYRDAQRLLLEIEKQSPPGDPAPAPSPQPK